MASSQSWSIDRFRFLVERRRPIAVAHLAVSAARALVRDLQQAAFHSFEAQRLIREATTDIQGETLPGLAVFRQLMNEAEPGTSKYPLREASFKASAHLLAFFRAAHGGTDLLAPAAYWSLGLAEKLPKPIPEKRISPTVVHGSLRETGLYPKVARAWDELIETPGYQYLRGLVNTMKHRELVTADFTVSFDFNADFDYGLQIGGFRYDKVYPPRWAGEFLGEEYPAIAQAIIRFGRTLNDELARDSVLRLPPNKGLQGTPGVP